MLGTAAAIALALYVPSFYNLVTPYASSALCGLQSLGGFWLNSTTVVLDDTSVCRPHSYTTEIVSLDPLLIYIHEFLTDGEIAALLAAGEVEFAPSEVTKQNQKLHTEDRTSQSAGLPPDNTAVQCVLGRAEKFMGSMLDPVRDEIGPPQLVRYTAGQRFNIHHDW